MVHNNVILESSLTSTSGSETYVSYVWEYPRLHKSGGRAVTCTMHYACLLCTIHVYYAQGASYSISPAYYSCRPSPGSPETWDYPSIRPWHPAHCHERHPMTWFVSPAGEPSIFQNFLFNGGIQEFWINPRWNVFLKWSGVLCFLIILDLYLQIWRVGCGGWHGWPRGSGVIFHFLLLWHSTPSYIQATDTWLLLLRMLIPLWHSTPSYIQAKDTSTDAYTCSDTLHLLYSSTPRYLTSSDTFTWSYTLTLYTLLYSSNRYLTYTSADTYTCPDILHPLMLLHPLTDPILTQVNLYYNCKAPSVRSVSNILHPLRS